MCQDKHNSNTENKPKGNVRIVSGCVSFIESAAALVAKTTRYFPLLCVCVRARTWVITRSVSTTENGEKSLETKLYKLRVGESNHVRLLMPCNLPD